MIGAESTPRRSSFSSNGVRVPWVVGPAPWRSSISYCGSEYASPEFMRFAFWYMVQVSAMARDITRSS